MNWIDAILVMWLAWTLFSGFAESARKMRGWNQIVENNRRQKL